MKDFLYRETYPEHMCEWREICEYCRKTHTQHQQVLDVW